MAKKTGIFFLNKRSPSPLGTPVLVGECPSGGGRGSGGGGSGEMSQTGQILSLQKKLSGPHPHPCPQSGSLFLKAWFPLGNFPKTEVGNL